jgi:hypothetical protein
MSEQLGIKDVRMNVLRGQAFWAQHSWRNAIDSFDEMLFAFQYEMLPMPQYCLSDD